jgi:hypothetical protein
VLPFKQEINTLRTKKGRKANYSGHMSHSTYLLKHVRDGKMEGWIEVAIRRGIRLSRPYDLKKPRGYWKLKEEALNLTL